VTWSKLKSKLKSLADFFSKLQKMNSFKVCNCLFWKRIQIEFQKHMPILHYVPIGRRILKSFYFNIFFITKFIFFLSAPSLTSLVEYNGDHKCLGNTCMCHVPHFVKAFYLQIFLWRVKTSSIPQYLKHTYNDNQWKLMMSQSPP